MSRKNERKTEARQHFGTGSHDGERFPFEPGPASPTAKGVNFYGHFSPSHARRLKAFAQKVVFIKLHDGEQTLRKWLSEKRLPGWLRKRITK